MFERPPATPVTETPLRLRRQQGARLGAIVLVIACIVLALAVVGTFAVATMVL